VDGRGELVRGKNGEHTWQNVQGTESYLRSLFSWNLRVTRVKKRVLLALLLSIIFCFSINILYVLTSQQEGCIFS